VPSLTEREMLRVSQVTAFSHSISSQGEPWSLDAVISPQSTPPHTHTHTSPIR
jgi:hypothetical protein